MAKAPDLAKTAPALAIVRVLRGQVVYGPPDKQTVLSKGETGFVPAVDLAGLVADKTVEEVADAGVGG